MSDCLRKLQPGLMFDDVEDMIDRKVQGGEGDGAFGLRCRRGSVLLGSWARCPLAHFLELSN